MVWPWSTCNGDLAHKTLEPMEEESVGLRGESLSDPLAGRWCLTKEKRWGNLVTSFLGPFGRITWEFSSVNFMLTMMSVGFQKSISLISGWSRASIWHKGSKIEVLLSGKHPAPVVKSVVR